MMTWGFIIRQHIVMYFSLKYDNTYDMGTGLIGIEIEIAIAEYSKQSHAFLGWKLFQPHTSVCSFKYLCRGL